MWIKICGNTNLEDALFAAENGADALGFVFAEGPRRVTVEQVREITPHLPARVQTYGVFVDAGFDAIVTAVLECNLTGVQIPIVSPIAPDPALPRRLKSYFADAIAGAPLQILCALHYSADLSEQLAEVHRSTEYDAVLIDSRTAKAFGGTGISYDWQAASEVFCRHSDLNLIAAGGLTPENVTEAISTLRPWGVDVVTGVEAFPGKKDHAKVRAFIQNARSASRP